MKWFWIGLVAEAIAWAGLSWALAFALGAWVGAGFGGIAAVALVYDTRLRYLREKNRKEFWDRMAQRWIDMERGGR